VHGATDQPLLQKRGAMAHCTVIFCTLAKTMLVVFPANVTMPVPTRPLRIARIWMQ